MIYLQKKKMYFQDYMNDTNGKEILLQYVTVKVPGKTPKGSKSYNAQGTFCLLHVYLTFLIHCKI